MFPGDLSSPKGGKSFSVYDDLRDRLLTGGLPEKEIAFVHEADTDAQKATLFKAVREGRVRVLLGSTAKMGIGTNVQTRLYALHHLDAPWRPCDVEQREGRLVAALLAVLESIPKHRADAIAQLEMKRKRLEDIQRELERPFEYESRLTELLARQRELLKTLDLDKDEAGTARMDAQEAKQAA